MTERVTGLAFGDGAEQRGDVGVALDVGLLGEVQVAAVGLALAGERLLQVVVGLGALQVSHARTRLLVVGGLLTENLLVDQAAWHSGHRPRNTISVTATSKP